MLVYGIRAIVTAAAILTIAGLALALVMTAKWELWFGLGIVVGIATGMTSLVLATKIATTWFVARRGLVLGILGAGNATGQLIFLPMAAWLADNYGWRSALLPSVWSAFSRWHSLYSRVIGHPILAWPRSALMSLCLLYRAPVAMPSQPASLPCKMARERMCFGRSS